MRRSSPSLQPRTLTSSSLWRTPARAAELVDLVVGGHSHSVSYGVADNGVAYIQGNCQAKGYANAKIQFNTETKEVTVVNPSYVNTTGRDNTQNLYDTEGNTKLDPTVLAISHASWDAVKGDMSEVLGVADQSITRRAPIGNSSSTIAASAVAPINSAPMAATLISVSMANQLPLRIRRKA